MVIPDVLWVISTRQRCGCSPPPGGQVEMLWYLLHHGHCRMGRHHPQKSCWSTQAWQKAVKSQLEAGTKY